MGRTVNFRFDQRTVPGRVVLLGLLGTYLLACAGPSQAQLEERRREAARFMRAKAVHMPPKGTDPCVGVTLRLTEAGGEEERAKLGARLSDATVESAMDAAGVERCRAIYREGILDAGLEPEPMQLKMGYGVDPAGKVCAVVERTRADPIDPGAVALIDESADCLKDTLFRAEFAPGMVKDLERIVKVYALNVDPVQTSTST